MRTKEYPDISLNHNYAFRLLLHLYSKPNYQCPLTTLNPEVSSNYATFRKLVDHMEREGLLLLIKTYSPYRRFDVKLTGKGIRIAEKLKEIEKEVINP